MKNKAYQKSKKQVSLAAAAVTGAVLLILVVAVTSQVNLKTETKNAYNAMQTLKQQCISFDRLVASNRTKSLFRLTDVLRNVRREIEKDPSSLNDKYLEQYTGNMRLSGIAVLDGDFKLEASGYTRKFKNEDWKKLSNDIQFSDISAYNNKIYATRVKFNGEYYDLCALSRTDCEGLIIGFYKQPSGLIDGTENDLESLLNGFHLNGNGQYAIAENGNVRVSSRRIALNETVDGNEILKNASDIKNDGRLHYFHANGKGYFGYHSGCEGYMIYIYYPFSLLFVSWMTVAGTFSAVYFIVCFLYYALRNRALYESHLRLSESNEQLTETVRMLKALETIYFSLFYLNIEDGTFNTIYLAPWLNGGVPLDGAYEDLRKVILGERVVDSFKEELGKITEYSFVREALNQKNITEAKKSFYRDYQAIRAGKIKWCRITVTAVDYDEDGYPVHVLALLQDVNDEKAKEAEYQARILKESQEAKIANNAKSEFLRHISHDIRTPINGIKGYIDIASQHPEDLNIQNYCREKAIVSIDVLVELISGLLDMSKLESGEIILEERPFDLTKLLDDINIVLSPQAMEKSVDYKVLRSGEVPVNRLIGSPRHVSQVIMNITGNAVKYSKPGGWIKVNTKLVKKTDTDVTYEFICADNGIGMSKEFQEHMFEPFMQEAKGARTSYEGLGLGLSIVKKLVDAMGGTVVCESERDKGTVFRIQLTFRIDKSYYNSDDGEIKDNKNILQGKNVLLVEDNEINMEIAELLLKGIGAVVTKAWNGKEAVEIFAASKPGYFDLIFMDIMMPEMGGFEATKRIRSLDRPDAKTVPVSAMTANAFSDDIRKSKEAGMDGHISKPLDEDKFIAVAAELLSGKRDL